MMAMEYIDMMSRMTMTVSATQPKFLTISVMVKADFRLSLSLPPCAWNRKTKKLSALLPRMLNRMVTVKILQKVFVCDVESAADVAGGTHSRVAARPFTSV